MERLRQTLQRIDGKEYKAYKDIAGSFPGDGFTLHVDYVQGDPFASPSRIRVEQLIDPSQTRAIANMMKVLADKIADGETPMYNMIHKLYELVEEERAGRRVASFRQASRRLGAFAQERAGCRRQPAAHLEYAMTKGVPGGCPTSPPGCRKSG